MNIKDIDQYFLNLQREPQNNCKYTLLYSRQGNPGNNFPFIVFLGHKDINKPNIILMQSKNIYAVMDYISDFLNTYKNIGYFYA